MQEASVKPQTRSGKRKEHDVFGFFLALLLAILDHTHTAAATSHGPVHAYDTVGGGASAGMATHAPLPNSNDTVGGGA